MQPCQAGQLGPQLARIGPGSGHLADQKPDSLRRGVSIRTQGLSRMRASRASGTRNAPIFLLSASTHTGRPGRASQRVPYRLSNIFCAGCGVSGRSPSTEPWWPASASRWSTWRARPPRAPRAGGSWRCRWRPQTTRKREPARAGLPAAPGLRADRRDSRRRAGARASRSRAGCAPWRRCACRRASNRRAGASPWVRGKCLRCGGDVARDQRGAELPRLERRHLLVQRADAGAFLVGQHGAGITAPGTWSSAYSAGERVSMMSSNSASCATVASLGAVVSTFRSIAMDMLA